jgi:SpoIID/LytB domain protein
MTKDEITLQKFISDQLSIWPAVSSAFRDLKSAQVRSLDVCGLTVTLQHNPARITSTTASIDPASIKARRCFLCAENEPPLQMRLGFDGRKGRGYNIQINPYPIFPQHLVIASKRHERQSIWHHYVDMLDLAATYPSFTFFYNGPRCGASAPDHLHFQACPRSLMPLETAVNESLAQLRDRKAPNLDYITSVQDAELYHFTGFIRGVFVLRGQTSKSVAKLFYRLVDTAPVEEGEDEPKFNLFSYYAEGEYRTIVVLRHRLWSHHYRAEGDDHVTMSFGCADIAGFFIAPVSSDFRKMTPELLGEMLEEVALESDVEKMIISRLTRTQPKIQVGILSAPTIRFEIISDGAGPQSVSYRDGKIDYNGVLYDELCFDAVTMSTLFAEPSFRLYDVVIGVDFHWQRKVNQIFAGSLRFIVEGDKVTAINSIGVEDYLLSVISSEMKSSASLEFLKAHAVISRSWVMSQLEHRRKPASGPVINDDTYITWFDHDDHKNFDVCADDHCQRYQGLSLVVGENVRKAIDETWGQVLTYGGEICDARFSKCCGGVTENFSTCWEDRDYPYLKGVPDTPGEQSGADPFCHTADEAVLSQVLNDYDLETRDFYEWEVRYTREELSELVGRRSGFDFGLIKDLVPLERGVSGRLRTLRIEGEKRTMTIGKELIIRRWLSESHLKSSAFDVHWEGDTVVLKGRGWGHGVGLCQIGAAVMASKGYDYRQILAHYYAGSEIK